MTTLPLDKDAELLRERYNAFAAACEAGKRTCAGCAECYMEDNASGVCLDTRSDRIEVPEATETAACEFFQERKEGDGEGYHT